MPESPYASERCALCGNEAIWRGHPLPLDIDHIDGDWRNNRIENAVPSAPTAMQSPTLGAGEGGSALLVSHPALKSRLPANMDRRLAAVVERQSRWV